MEKNRNHDLETIHIFNNLELWIKIGNANFLKRIYISQIYHGVTFCPFGVTFCQFGVTFCHFGVTFCPFGHTFCQYILILFSTYDKYIIASLCYILLIIIQKMCEKIIAQKVINN
jgi:hypothetical protein